MLPFPTLDDIQKEFSNKIDSQAYALARQDYERKLVSEVRLLEQFKSRPGLTENEAVTMFCKFLIREAVYIASHTGE